jgi:hypothetical protein
VARLAKVALSNLFFFKLKNSVQVHGDKDWVAVAVLVPGRTKEEVLEQMACCLEFKNCSDHWTYGLIWIIACALLENSLLQFIRLLVGPCGPCSVSC